MTLHLIKLCVGVDKVEELQDWCAEEVARQRNSGEREEIVHVTRMTPKRADELLDGGSLYWVIKRQVQARQKIVELRPVTGKDGKSRCAIVLDPTVVLTQRIQRRPFQGWRYLTAADAPPDARGIVAEVDENMPDDLKAELSELGLL